MVKRDYYREKRDKALEILGNKCNTCGSTDNLEIDHIDWRLKTIDLGKQWCSDLYFEELKKCQLLCNSCHIAKTKIDRPEQEELKEEKHGTYRAVFSKKCKCKICLNYKREFYNKRNKSRREKSKRQPYNNVVKCGNIRNYYRGCRCSKCRKANADKERARRESKK